MEKIHNIDDNYKNLISKILEEEYEYEDPNRKGVIRKEILSHTISHNFKEGGFPSISLRSLNFKNVVVELLFFLKGYTNIKYLIDNGCNIWNKDALNYHKLKYKADINLPMHEFLEQVREGVAGDLGKIYGYYWRNYEGFDQIQDIIDKMINTPMSSEIIVTARNPNDKDNQALPCCHYGFQITVRPLKSVELWKTLSLDQKKPYIGKDYKKNLWIEEYNLPKYGFELHWNQRSVDTYLGLNFNISSYALLSLILGHLTNLEPLGIQGDLKKVHLYDNSIDASKELLTRKSSTEKSYIEFSSRYLGNVELFKKGELSLNHFIEQLEPNMFSLKNYFPQENIKVEMLARTI